MKKILNKEVYVNINGMQLTQVLKTLEELGDRTSYEGVFSCSDDEVCYQYKMEEMDSEYYRRLTTDNSFILELHKARREQYEKLKKEFE
jgi:hypothetical protein